MRKLGAAWGADGALAEGVGEGDAFGDEAIEVWRVYVGIAEGVNGVEPLLVLSRTRECWGDSLAFPSLLFTVCPQSSRNRS